MKAYDITESDKIQYRNI